MTAGGFDSAPTDTPEVPRIEGAQLGALDLAGVAAGILDRIAPDLGVGDGHGFVIA